MRAFVFAKCHEAIAVAPRHCFFFIPLDWLNSYAHRQLYDAATRLIRAAQIDRIESHKSRNHAAKNASGNEL